MVRDTEDGKLDYTLVLDGPMLKRWAAHLTKGAKKYAPRNWMKATGEEELARFKRSFLRHAVAWLDGETDEDHAAAIIFNVNGVEYVRAQQTESLDFLPHERWRDMCRSFDPSNAWECERDSTHTGLHGLTPGEYPTAPHQTWE